MRTSRKILLSYFIVLALLSAFAQSALGVMIAVRGKASPIVSSIAIPVR
jgi:hypothetical protein